MSDKPRSDSVSSQEITEVPKKHPDLLDRYIEISKAHQARLETETAEKHRRAEEEARKKVGKSVVQTLADSKELAPRENPLKRGEVGAPSASSAPKTPKSSAETLNPLQLASQRRELVPTPPTRPNPRKGVPETLISAASSGASRSTSPPRAFAPKQVEVTRGRE